MFLRFPCEILRSKTLASKFSRLYYNISKNVCLQEHFYSKIRRGRSAPKCSTEHFNSCIILRNETKLKFCRQLSLPRDLQKGKSPFLMKYCVKIPANATRLRIFTCIITNVAIYSFHSQIRLPSAIPRQI